MAENDLSSFFDALGAPEPLQTTGGGTYTGGGEPLSYTSYGPTADTALGYARSYLSGPTLGLFPKIEAGVSSLFTDKTYEQELADIETAQKAFRAQSPIASTATEIAPSLVLNPLGALGTLARGTTIAKTLSSVPTIAKYVENTPELLQVAQRVAPAVMSAEKAIQAVPGGIITSRLLGSVPSQSAIEGALRAEGDESMAAAALKGGLYGSVGSAVSDLAGRGLGRLANEADRLRLSAFGLNSWDVTGNIKKAEQVGQKVTKSTEAPLLKTVKRLQTGEVINPENEVLQNIANLAAYQDDLGVELMSRLEQASDVIPAAAGFQTKFGRKFLDKLSGTAKDEAQKILDEERDAIFRQFADGGTILDLQKAKTGLNYVWDSKPYSEDIRKALRADLREEIENRVAIGEKGGNIAKQTAEEIRAINKEWGDAADLKDVFARKAGRDLGPDVVEDAFGSMRTSGGPGSLNIISAVTGNPIYAIAGAGLNAMRAKAGKNFLADVLEDPLAKKVGSKLGEALQEVGQGRAFAIGGTRAEQGRLEAQKKDETVKDAIIQGLRGVNANSKPEEIRKALEGLKRKVDKLEAQGTGGKVEGATVGKISYEPEAIKGAILQQDPFTQAMISAESKGDPFAKSKAGAEGMLQLMPATAKELGVKNPRDYNENIAGGKKYFNQLMAKYDNDRKLALAAYNWGMGNVDKARARVKSKGLADTWDNIMRYASVPSETENYVAYVMREQGKIRNNPEGYWDKILSRRTKQVTA
jgi:hypothetical protein